MKNCINCLLPETHETITFDKKGSCNVCTNFKFKNENVNWKKKNVNWIS